MIIRGTETVLVQGITGKQGMFWSERMRDYGTRIIGGVNPKRAGDTHLALPVWATAGEAARETAIDAAVMFIPPMGVKDAALDIINAGIGKIVCLTEHVPVHDTMYVLAAARERGASDRRTRPASSRSARACRLHAGIQRARSAGQRGRRFALRLAWRCCASTWCRPGSASRCSSGLAAIGDWHDHQGCAGRPRSGCQDGGGRWSARSAAPWRRRPPSTPAP